MPRNTQHGTRMSNARVEFLVCLRAAGPYDGKWSNTKAIRRIVLLLNPGGFVSEL